MPDLTELESPQWQRSTFRWLLLFYSLFIVYGSFIPFFFNFDPNFIQWRWQTLVETLSQPRLRKYSTPDAVSNVLLFIPFGFFFTVHRMVGRRPSGILAIMLCSTAMGLLFSSAIEMGQTLTPMRTPSVFDILCNTGGSAAGALLGFHFHRQLGGVVAPWINFLIYRRPSLLVLLFVMLAPAVNSFYPFEITLDLSFLWDNLKRAQFLPLQQPLHRPWLELLLEKSLPFAAMSFLVMVNLPPRPGQGNQLIKGWLICAAMACALEMGKLFFAGRTFIANNLMFALAGAALGAGLYRPLTSAGKTPRRALTALLGLAVAVLGYFQLEPFDWIARQELIWKFYQIEWYPFTNYYWADPRAALFDLLKKIYLTIPVGYLLSAAVSRTDRKANSHAIAMAALLGLALETLQLLVRSRTPSLTDVLIIATGAALGVRAHLLYLSIKHTNESSGRSLPSA